MLEIGDLVMVTEGMKDKAVVLLTERFTANPKLKERAALRIAEWWTEGDLDLPRDELASLLANHYFEGATGLKDMTCKRLAECLVQECADHWAGNLDRELDSSVEALVKFCEDMDSSVEAFAKFCEDMVSES